MTGNMDAARVRKTYEAARLVSAVVEVLDRMASTGEGLDEAIGNVGVDPCSPAAEAIRVATGARAGEE